MKEADEPSKERLEAAAPGHRERPSEALDKRKAEWQNEKDAIVIGAEPEGRPRSGAQLEEERATREGDLATASELRFGRIPELQAHAARSRTADARRHARQMGAILKEEVSERRDRRGGVYRGRASRITKMMQGEMAKLVDLEDQARTSAWSVRTRPCRRWRVRSGAAVQGSSDPEQAHRQLLVPRADGRGQDRACKGACRVPVR